MASDSSQDPLDAVLRPNWQGALPAGADPLFVGIGAICDTAARLTGADGAALAVLTPTRGVRELAYATDALAQQLDEVQFTVGEGPCLDAYHEDRPLLCAELDDKTLDRWPAFSSELVGLEVAALFAFPVPGQHRPMGVLELYRRTAGALGDGAHRSAQLCAAALQRTLESNWAQHLRHSTTEEAAIEAAAVSGSSAANSDPFTRQHVYVAAGMMAVQLEITTSAALDRLRAYAFSHHVSVTAVAADVVARRLSFRHLGDSSVDS
ncbi:Uncharacterised protein [Mycolicibacterium vanbaalenii]|uniref:GAF domain-containing protein n=1 Tax=Mycolicibacterium vanbaalenii TaxID=110539 RepID=A0A5S9R2J6_MYCVN|nr:GAF domain-containing protein [Mycolicibacterium vanbaalenii]CAA0128323.1 Uncharacterised protein [Mycolicibacterium vanbaalenii]